MNVVVSAHAEKCRRSFEESLPRDEADTDIHANSSSQLCAFEG